MSSYRRIINHNAFRIAGTNHERIIKRAVPTAISQFNIHHCITRNYAGRRTTVRIEDLPQGVLPPLPKNEVEEPAEKRYPPMLQQHLENVRKFSDCIVLTRVGDFYEMYFDQVEQYAPQVNLKKAKKGDVSMAGFQHTQLERYLKMFVQDLGKKVAISEQIEIPAHERDQRPGAPKFDRKVTRVITAGTLIDESFIDPLEKNFLLSIKFPDDVGTESSIPDLENDIVGISWVDVSSGDFYLQNARLSNLASIVARVGPQEIVLESSLESLARSDLFRILGETAAAVTYHNINESEIGCIEDWTPMLERESDYPEDFSAEEVSAGNLVLDYIKHRLFEANIKLQPPIHRSEDEYMSIDKQTLRALEIKATLRDGVQVGSLIHAIRRTTTRSGARLLSQRILSPSMSLQVINSRLDLVQEMLRYDSLRESIIALLKDTSDTSRLLQKFSIDRGDADDMLGLARTINLTQSLSDLLHDHIIAEQDRDRPLDVDHLWNILKRLDLAVPNTVANSILSTIDEEGLSKQQRVEIEKAEQAGKLVDEVLIADATGQETPKLARRMSKTPSSALASTESEDIWVMRQDASPALKSAHKHLASLYDEKQSLCLNLRARLKTDSLTLRFSPQTGLHCHVKGKDKHIDVNNVPGLRMISQSGSTKTFAAQEWTELGPKIDAARQAVRNAEDKMFQKLRANILENLPRLRRNAAILDELDVACSSAIIAKERNMVRPILNEGTSHMIVEGRHPTVDAGLLSNGRQFTANDCSVGDKEMIYLITGPNMAGKSTYLRQNALITILAQTGCFVPAEYAEIGLVDKIFSRVGSADSLYQDQSTFMVEMLETAVILKQATARSFVIMDEVGRGTTPQDGLAVGFACLHHLHSVNQCRTLFATHFHDLADMTREFEKLSCYCTDVAENEDGSWMYVHKLQHGVNRKSHALKVARIAGLPELAIEVADEVLNGRVQRDQPSTHEQEAATA